MLNQVLKYLNTYFPKYTNCVLQYSYTKDVTFTVNGVLTATSFDDTFICGEYIRIEGSRMNDGVYRVEAIDSTTLTVDSTVDITISAEPEIEVTITKCYIPLELLDMVTEIKTYNTNVTDGVSSESQGQRSVSYAEGSTGWKNAFNSRLSTYRKLGWC